MSVAFPNLSWWLWSGKKVPKISSSLKSSSSSEFDGMELDMVKSPAVASNSRRRRNWHPQEEGKVDKDLDVVLVSSESESDSSDWSIGWSEPHASGFLSEDGIDCGFGVLVRCYNNGRKHHFPVKNGNVPLPNSSDNKKYMEQWLSSLQES